LNFFGCSLFVFFVGGSCQIELLRDRAGGGGEIGAAPPRRFSVLAHSENQKWGRQASSPAAVSSWSLGSCYYLLFVVEAGGGFIRRSRVSREVRRTTDGRPALPPPPPASLATCYCPGSYRRDPSAALCSLLHGGFPCRPRRAVDLATRMTIGTSTRRRPDLSVAPAPSLNPQRRAPTAPSASSPRTSCCPDLSVAPAPSLNPQRRAPTAPSASASSPRMSCSRSSSPPPTTGRSHLMPATSSCVEMLVVKCISRAIVRCFFLPT
jgi:hypothetical protein